MNILIPHKWLLDHLETTVTPQELQKLVSLCGPSIERIYDREGDQVYDIEVTTNRVDSMSVRGIAREAAVILTQFGKKAKLKKLKLTTYLDKEHKTAKSVLPLPQIIDDKNICKRTLCVVLANADRNPTPEWMATRLKQVEISIHDAVIDITNYITHDLGHPCHAFDYDRVMDLGGIIIIKEARPGKKFTTLDGITYTTVGGEIVFENEKGEIIDLPGIKGTANTSINQSTRNVLFWIENIEAKKIRFGSMSHAIRTVAAQLNEKNVDPHLAGPVFEAGIKLFEDLTGAQIASKIHDHFPAEKQPQSVEVSLNKITEYLGVELPVNTIAQILEDLECDVQLKGGKKKKGATAETGPSLIVTPPTFRPDIEIPADVIEEIARIYGYHNLPSVLMPTAIPLNKPTNTNFHIENRIKRFLSDIGWQEVFTYSMVSAELAAQSGYKPEEHLKILNPLTDDRVYMRRSLIPSHEEVITMNSQRTGLSIFEVANIYDPREKGLPNETLHLSLTSTKEFRLVKGDLEALLKQFFVSEYRVEPVESMTKLYGQKADVVIKETGSEKYLKVGEIGVLPNGHTAIDITVAEFLKVVHTHPTYQPLPKTSEVIEDLTFTLPEKVAVGGVLVEVEKVSTLIRSVKLHDIYQQNFTFTLTYHNPQQNLQAEDVAPVRKQVIDVVEKNYGGQLVGKVE
jgi:phenylalanyl-tRNA synthetase beta chain